MRTAPDQPTAWWMPRTECRFPRRTLYQLRRLWIDEPAFSAYYGGFSNEGLWPLCHMVDVRPQFRSEDWAAYQDVNVRFAAAIDQELAAAPTTPIFIHDYHLALVAPALRARRPDARTALFWHIRGRIRIACASVRGGRRF